MIDFAMFTGIAKPMPMLPPLLLKMAELMPTSSPLRLIEGAAGIAGIDRGVGLDEVLVAVRVDAAAAEGADDARGDRVLEAEGIADRQDEVADLHLVGIAELHLDEVLAVL